MTGGMMVVIAMKIGPYFERTIQICLYSFPDIAGGAADHFDFSLRKGVDRSGTDTAADQHIYFGRGKAGCQRTMTGFTGR